MWTYGELRVRGTSEGKLRWEVEEGRLVRVLSGTYLPGPAGEWDRMRAIALRVPDGAFALGSAARLYGFGGFAPGDRPVMVIPAGAPRPRLRGLRIVTTTLSFEPVLFGGVPCTPAARTVIDLARISPRVDALPVIDGALRVGACTVDELTHEVRRHHHLRGVVQAAELIDLGDAGAQCRQESQLRLVLRDGGVPMPRTQVPILDSSHRIRYILDLGWESRRVGAEYDGVSHVSHESVRHDRERQNWLAEAGWRMRYFTDRDLYRRPCHVVAVMRAALAG